MRMKKVFLCLLLLLGVLVGQAQGRWTMSLGVMRSNIATIDKVETKLLPSISYNFNSWFSAGVELGLPLTDNGVYTSTGVELFGAFRSPRLGAIRLSLLPVLGASTVGAYGFSRHYGEGLYLDSGCERFTRIDVSSVKYRWYLGVRPMLDFAIDKHWGINITYSFFGVRAPQSVNKVLIFNDEKVDEFHGSVVNSDTSISFNNALKVGISYSF